jgi:hypothetical protein
MPSVRLPGGRSPRGLKIEEHRWDGFRCDRSVMIEKRHLEFVLLRYVADAIKQITLPIGIVMHEPGREDGFADVQFTHDWRQVRCIDPQADVEMLAALEREIRSRLVLYDDRTALLRQLQDSFSNVVQVSPATACLTADPAHEIEAMASMYLEAGKVGRIREETGHQKILTSMRDSFKNEGIEKLIVPVPAAPYTKPGDPFRFDFGYRVRDEIKLFHAVSLKASVDAAVMLAARYPKIAPVMSAKTEAGLALTAVIDDDLDRGQDRIQFALSMMEEEAIQIAVAAEMPTIAKVARKELHA